VNRRAALLTLVATALGAESFLSAPASLTVEGIPPIPVALAENIARYNSARSASLMDWHPVRREMLIETRFGDTPQIHRVLMPGGARTQLTFFSDRVGAEARYRPPSGEWFLFSKDTGGGEFYQLFLYDGNRGESTMITDGKSRNTSPRWSADGRWLAYSSTKRNGADTDLYMMDPSDPNTARLVLRVDGGTVSASDWSPDGRSLIITQRIGTGSGKLYLLNIASGAKEALVEDGERDGLENVRFSKDGKGVYLTSTAGGEFHRLAYLDLSTRKVEFLIPDQKWDAEKLTLSKSGDLLAFLLNEDGADTVHVLDTRSRTEISLPKIPYGVIGALRWHGNGRDLGFSLASARSPSDVYSIDVKTGALERWTASETGGLNPENFSEPELIRWKSFDGRTISGYLYLPPKGRFSGKRPVMINIHGGPASQSRPGFLGRMNYYLNELGVAVIFPNVRGSTGYGKTFQKLDDADKREDSVKDIGALLDWIGARGDFDAGRVMVTGGSYGGYMTLASMVHYGDRLRCGADTVGISNWVTFLERTESYRRDNRRREYGDERKPEMRELLLKISPANHADRITKPLMIVAGKNDPRVPASEGEQMAAAIRKRGGTAWRLEAADEGHGFAKKKNQDFQFAATVMFVKEYLLR
jgi:dipeptidyl aminopeptidase/acylaminoacyl peptidase